LIPKQTAKKTLAVAKRKIDESILAEYQQLLTASKSENAIGQNKKKLKILFWMKL
jgi:hypothetical protein